MSANGDIVVGEMRLRALMAAGADTLLAELDSVLGTAWDDDARGLPRRRPRGRGELAQPRGGVTAADRRIFNAPLTADTSTGSGHANSPSA